MIILDTNVVSELYRAAPSETVMAWIRQQPLPHTYITAITAAELRYGIKRLPDGHRKTALMSRIEDSLANDFTDRCLAFDMLSTPYYADICTERNQVGRPISQADAMIAAITRAHDFTLVTRNIRDFDRTGIKLHNPWDDQ